MLFTGPGIHIGINCAQGFGTQLRAFLKTEGTVFPDTDQPWWVNNILIFFCMKTTGTGGLATIRSGLWAR